MAIQAKEESGKSAVSAASAAEQGVAVLAASAEMEQGAAAPAV